MAWMKDKAPATREQMVGDVKFTVRKCYTDTEGNAWYEFDDPLRMPAQRALAGEIAATWADLNITKSDLRDYIKRMKASGQKGDIVKMFHLLSVLEERVEWTCEDRTLLQLAQVYFVINDEPLMAGTQEHNALKDRIWGRDPDCRAFFLRMAFVLTSGYSKFSAPDIVSYLEVQKARLARSLEPQPASSTGKGQSAKPSSSERTTSTNKRGYLPVKSRRK